MTLNKYVIYTWMCVVYIESRIHIYKWVKQFDDNRSKYSLSVLSVPIILLFVYSIISALSSSDLSLFIMLLKEVRNVLLFILGDLLYTHIILNWSLHSCVSMHFVWLWFNYEFITTTKSLLGKRLIILFVLCFEWTD